MSPDYKVGKRGHDWVVVWYEGGKRHRIRLDATTQTEARAALNAFKAERERIARSTRRQIVEHFYADYIADREANGTATVRRMRDVWKRLGPAFGAMDPGDISDKHVRDYITSNRRAGMSDGTTRIDLACLQAALRLAEARGHISHAPRIKQPPQPRPRERHLTGDEARRLIDACATPHMKLYVLMALYTAGRPSAILDLTWDRVDIARGKILLDNPERDRTKKGRATVPLPKELIEPLLEAQRGARTKYVIEWAGARVRSIKKGIARAAERAGLKDITAYCLRHTSAVWMVEAGRSFAEVAQFLGHSSPNITFSVYGRYSPDHLQTCAEAISARLGGSK